MKDAYLQVIKNEIEKIENGTGFGSVTINIQNGSGFHIESKTSIRLQCEKQAIDFSAKSGVSSK